MEEKKEKNKVQFLRDNYKGTKNYAVIWESSYNPKREDYHYMLYIRHTGAIPDTVLAKWSYDYNYLIELFNVFMRKSNDYE